MMRKLHLLDPQTYGIKLEWLVAECIEGQRIPILTVLCFKEPCTIKDPHQEISFIDFSLDNYTNLMMKPFPDNYGAGIHSIKIEFLQR
jgi:hypothetical protein